MLMPSIFEENLLDDFFGYSFGSHKTFDTMNTDIKDTESGYEIAMDMPGVKEKDVGIELKDGYLAVQTIADSSRDERDSNGTYIHRERYTDSRSKSLYVGDAVTREDIEAKFEDGTLKMLVPKEEAKPAVEEERYTAIEG